MSEPTFKTLPLAIAHIASLNAIITTKDSSLSTANNSLQSALKEKADVEAKLGEANSKLEAEKTRADSAEKSLTEAKGKYETIEARIEAEATLKAVDQIAAAGGNALKLVDGENKGTQPGSDSSVTASNFWEQYRNQTPSAKASFYKEHKHVIGR